MVSWLVFLCLNQRSELCNHTEVRIIIYNITIIIIINYNSI